MVEQYFEKLLSLIKMPLWSLMGITIALGAVIFLIPAVEIWLFIFFIISLSLTVTKSINDIFKFCLKYIEGKKTFHLTPIQQQCYWKSSKQSDGTMATLLVADFKVKNCTSYPIVLVDGKVKKWLWTRKLIERKLVVDYSSIRKSSFDPMRGETVLVGPTLPLSVTILLNANSPQRVGKDFKAKLCIFDSEGNKKSIKVIFKSVGHLAHSELKKLIEIPSLITICIVVRGYFL